MHSLLQTDEWASLKEKQGWKVFDVAGIKVLGKSLPLGFSFLYVPELEYQSIANLQNFLQNIQKIAKNFSSIFFRLEILDENRPEIIKNLKQNGFIKAFEELQPEWRQIIDISKSEDEILAQMKPKGRYNIKVAQKSKVKVERISEEDLLENIDVFYNLFRQTSQNQHFEIRPKKYFQDLLTRLYAVGWADLLIARFEKVPVAGLIITYYDGVATFLYGASSMDYRHVMAPYLAHYEAICAAKKRGCQKYDLLAIASPGQENHKYTGITRFKEQFGGEKVNIVGSYDLVYKPFWYKLFKMAEQRRRN